MKDRGHQVVRSAQLADINAITRIYAHHVKSGTGSFEETPPAPEEMASRFTSREQAGYPTLVCETPDAEIIGFAYAGVHKPRSAYRHTVEDSVYVDPAYAGQGIGFQLMTKLIECCTDLGYHQMMAVVGDSGNVGSIKLHEKLGFRMIGTAEGIGFKHGQWLDVVYMQRTLKPNAR